MRIPTTFNVPAPISSLSLLLVLGRLVTSAKGFQATQQLLATTFLDGVLAYTNTSLPAESGGPWLRRRSASCGTSYHACGASGAAGVCCPANAVCSADAVGQVACCPVGAVCTGLVSGYGAAVTSTVYVVQTTATQAVVVVTSTIGGGALATATAGGYIVSGGTTVALLPNAAGRRAEAPWLVRVMVEWMF